MVTNENLIYCHGEDKKGVYIGHLYKIKSKKNDLDVCEYFESFICKDGVTFYTAENSDANFILYITDAFVYLAEIQSHKSGSSIKVINALLKNFEDRPIFCVIDPNNGIATNILKNNFYYSTEQKDITIA